MLQYLPPLIAVSQRFPPKSAVHSHLVESTSITRVPRFKQVSILTRGDPVHVNIFTEIANYRISSKQDWFANRHKLLLIYCNKNLEWEFIYNEHFKIFTILPLTDCCTRTNMQRKVMIFFPMQNSILSLYEEKRIFYIYLKAYMYKEKVI